MKTRKLKSVCLVVVCVAMVLALAGCSGGGNTQYFYGDWFLFDENGDRIFVAFFASDMRVTLQNMAGRYHGPTVMDGSGWGGTWDIDRHDTVSFEVHRQSISPYTLVGTAVRDGATLTLMIEGWIPMSMRRA